MSAIYANGCLFFLIAADVTCYIICHYHYYYWPFGSKTDNTSVFKRKERGGENGSSRKFVKFTGVWIGSYGMQSALSSYTYTHAHTTLCAGHFFFLIRGKRGLEIWAVVGTDRDWVVIMLVLLLLLVLNSGLLSI